MDRDRRRAAVVTDAVNRRRARKNASPAPKRRAIGSPCSARRSSTTAPSMTTIPVAEVSWS